MCTVGKIILLGRFLRIYRLHLTLVTKSLRTSYNIYVHVVNYKIMCTCNA